jgi:hypothetical protein
MCCGKQRAAASEIATLPAGNDLLIDFQYVGGKTLIVLGPVSHRRYRFEGPGAIVAIDTRDRPALAHIPFLRQVKRTTHVATEF